MGYNYSFMSTQNRRQGNQDGPTESFYYPDQRDKPRHRTCAKGQRRVAWDATLIHNEVNTGEVSPQVTQLVERAARAELLLGRDIRPSKDDIIAYQSVSAYTRGELHRYVDEHGNFVLETVTGVKVPRNVHQEIADGKEFY